MLIVNVGCSPHLVQRGDVGLARSCFSIAAQNAETVLRAS
jgi:hypothetical protein